MPKFDAQPRMQFGDSGDVLPGCEVAASIGRMIRITAKPPGRKQPVYIFLPRAAAQKLIAELTALLK